MRMDERVDIAPDFLHDAALYLLSATRRQDARDDAHGLPQPRKGATAMILRAEMMRR